MNDPVFEALKKMDAEQSAKHEQASHEDATLIALQKLDAQEAAATERRRQEALAGGSGPLSAPPGIARQFADDVGGFFKAIPTGFNDAYSMGAIPRAAERAQGYPAGTYQRQMDENPAGANTGKLLGTAASFVTGPGKLIASGVGKLAAPLAAKAPGLASLFQAAAPAGTYSAADAAARGGSTADVVNAGMAGATLGAAVPAAIGTAGSVGRKLFGASKQPLVQAAPAAEEVAAQEAPASVASEAAPIAPAEQAASKSMADASVARSMIRKSQQLLNDSVKGAAIKGTDKLQRAAGQGGIANEDIIGSGEDMSSGGARIVASTAEELGLGKDLLGSVPKFTREVLKQRKEVGQKLGRLVDEGTLPTPGVSPEKVWDSLAAAQAKEAPGTAAYEAYASEMKTILNDYAPKGAIPLWQLKKLAKSFADKGYATEGRSYLSPRESASIARGLNRAVLEPLHEEINRVLVENPHLGSPAEYAALRNQYTKLSGLVDIATAARPKAYLGRPGLIETIKEMGKAAKEHAAEGGVMGTILGAGAVAHQEKLATLIAGATAAKPVLAAADTQIAKLVMMARQGWPAHAYQQAAASMGIDGATAATVWRNYAAPALSPGFAKITNEAMPAAYGRGSQQ